MDPRIDVASRDVEQAALRAGRWVIFAAVLTSSMAFIDGTALNVALPALQADLHATGAQLLWIVNAYAVLLAALLLVGGSLGDHYGRRRMVMVGIGIFAGASSVCGLAPNTTLLIVARGVQGIGGALMTPGSLAIISAFFRDRQRGAAIGTWSAWSTTTTLLGPLLGGVLAAAGLWRAVFLINLPLAVVALGVLHFKVPESRAAEGPVRLDLPGALCVTVGLLGITYGCLSAPAQGWGRPPVLVALVGGVAALAAFVVVEARSDHPLVPLMLFRSRTFSGANMLTLLLYGALAVSSFLLPLNLIQVQHYSAALAGLASLPSVVLLAVLSRTTGAVADRFGPRVPLTIGPSITGTGFLLYTLPGVTTGAGTYWTTFFPGVVLVGIGLGITVAPLTAAVMGAVAQPYIGTASGVNNAVARAAAVVAIAVLGGLALVSFQAALTARTRGLGLSNTASAALRRQAANLGAASVPPELEPETAKAVAAAIPLAFVDTFRVTLYVATALAWGSALLAWITIAPGPSRRPTAVP
ncbi:MAG: MFS transporter [Herpetosiphon sp.]